MPPLLTAPQLARELTARPGLIPVDIRLTGGCPDFADWQIEWLDLQQYHCYHGQFADALRFYRAVCKEGPATFLSSCDSFASLRGPASGESIPPTGLIFHAGRCGSTLLARVLARSRQHLVFGEAAAHNSFWKFAPNVSDRTEFYHSLVLAMARRRLPSYQSHYIKFTSFNILRFEEIRAAFPATPALFLFRDPGPMLDSFYKGPPGWMGVDVGLGDPWRTPEEAIEAFYRAALAAPAGSLRYLHYPDFSPDALPELLGFLRADVSDKDMQHMKAEFLLDAKSAAPRPFVPRPLSSSRAIPPHIQSLYSALLERARQ